MLALPVLAERGRLRIRPLRWREASLPKEPSPLKPDLPQSKSGLDNRDTSAAICKFCKGPQRGASSGPTFLELIFGTILKPLILPQTCVKLWRQKFKLSDLL